MPCYHPLKGFLSDEVNPSGKRSVVFGKGGALPIPVSVPCGKCIGCRLEMSRQWAVRCVHEASLYDKNCFITLTYDDKKLPPDRYVDGHPCNYSLVKSDFQKFMKRLRSRFRYLESASASCNIWGRVSVKRHWRADIRYFQCGEYGSRLERPHFHACLFNFDFEDKFFWSIRDNIKLFRSATLEELWPFGFSTIGDVNFDTAAYVARYVLKKVGFNKFNPKHKDNYYNGRIPEYITMSRRPGIGAKWFSNFGSDIYPHGFAVIGNGVKVKPPKYYENIFDLTNHDLLDKIKTERAKKALHSKDNSPARLDVREQIHLDRARQLKRGFEL